MISVLICLVLLLLVPVLSLLIALLSFGGVRISMESPKNAKTIPLTTTANAAVTAAMAAVAPNQAGSSVRRCILSRGPSTPSISSVQAPMLTRTMTTSVSSFRFSETSPDNCNLTNNSIPVPFPFSARMVHSRQSRTKRPFQPVFRGGKQRFSVLPTAGFRKGRGLAIGERQRMVQNPPACPTIAFPIARQWLTHWRAVSFLPTS